MTQTSLDSFETEADDDFEAFLERLNDSLRRDSVTGSVEANETTREKFEADPHDVYDGKSGFSSHKGSTVTVPSVEAAVLYDGLRVIFTDGGFPAEERSQLQHPHAYGGATIEIDEGRRVPHFDGPTHERLGSFTEFLEMASHEKHATLREIRLCIGDVDFSWDDLDDVIEAFDQMEYGVMLNEENCDRCNPDIYSL